MIILDNYASACLIADLEAPMIRPGGKKVDRFKRIKWKDATEEQRENLTWVRYGLDGPKTAHIPLTSQEKEEVRLNEEKIPIYAIAGNHDSCQYLLDNFGVEYAKRFAEANKVNIDLNVPYCLNNNQCNLFCPFYKGRCMKGENDEN